MISISSSDDEGAIKAQEDATTPQHNINIHEIKTKQKSRANSPDEPVRKAPNAAARIPKTDIDNACRVTQKVKVSEVLPYPAV